jgi:hypothetical protein
MKIVDDGAATEVEEVLAGATVAGTASLPPVDVRESMLNRHPLPQLRSALRCQLPSAQLLEETFIWMDMDAATAGTGGAALPERTDLALVLREVHGRPRPERDHHLVGAANGTGIAAGSVRMTSQGVPFLLIGLWWVGRELGRSITAGRIRKSRR